VHPLIRLGLPPAELRGTIATSVAEALRCVDNRAFARRFHAAMPVPGAPLEAYAYHLLAIESGQHLIAGIRFRGDPPFSFVEVYARDFPIERAETSAAMLDVTRRTFAVFTPSYLRVHVAAGSLEDTVIEQFPGSTDFFTMAGLVRTLQAHPLPPHMDRLQLVPATSTAFYDAYLDAYRDVHAATPSLRDLVPVASRATLEGCLAQGLLFEAVGGGEWAGIIAGRAQTDAGMRGYRVVDEVLAPRYCGRGLGAALQRHFIDALPATDTYVVHGAIHPLNAPSLATAKRVGRTEVMHTHFLNLRTELSFKVVHQRRVAAQSTTCTKTARRISSIVGCDTGASSSHWRKVYRDVDGLPTASSLRPACVSLPRRTDLSRSGGAGL